ncbi:MAG: ribosome biogenesis GTPase Der [Bacteroidia bacterium]|nr:ribosome biogenesis GTPase Der [Bacteroidia bacterium]MDW8417180.1 ribosome biogenesis GTPase Der [Bacteroidia bacterium]
MRKVALIGRTNVGKSSLFNRLIGRRQAIVEDEPGVTRDRHYGIVNLDGGRILLIDTGGFLGETDTLEAQVSQQVRFAIEEADLLLWVVDAETGLTPSDEEFAAWLRRYRRSTQPLWLIVNKSDNPTRETAVTEFYRLGIEPIYTASATTGRGLSELREALLAFAQEGETGIDGPRFALIGRPNVGKSSLLNALLRSPRAIVSDLPGTTRDPLYEPAEWKNQKFYWVDTAGLRRRTRIPTFSVEKYASLRSLEALATSDVVLLVIDATEALTAQDMTLLRQAEKQGKGIVLLLNKSDLLTPSQGERLIQWVSQKVRPLQPVPILLVSALTSRGISEIPESALKVYKEGQYEIPTRHLNDTILPILRQYPHPLVGNIQPSIRLLQQIGTKPPLFLLHARHPEKIRKTYLNFIENQIRKIYPFSGWRLRFELRGSEG